MVPRLEEKGEDDAGDQKAHAVHGKAPPLAQELRRLDREDGACDRCHEAPEDAHEGKLELAGVAAGRDEIGADKGKHRTEKLALPGATLHLAAHIGKADEHLEALQHRGRRRVRPCYCHEVGDLREEEGPQSDAQDAPHRLPVMHERRDPALLLDPRCKEEEPAAAELAEAGDPEGVSRIAVHQALHERAIAAPERSS